MKKLIFIFLIIIYSCKSTNGLKSHEYYGGKFSSQIDTVVENDVWIQSFKKEVFFECLKKGYKNDSIFKLIQKEDLFCTYENMLFNDIKRARYFGDSISKKIKSSIYQYDDVIMNNKRYVICTCLDFYTSRDLDSIAKEEYERYLKNTK